MNPSVTHRPVTVVEPGTVKVERLLSGPVERVWAYLVESDKRARWLAAGEFELRVGGKVRLEPLRLLAHTWRWDSVETEVSYELAPRGKQVLLTIVHRRLTKPIVAKVLGGWDVHSGILEDLLNGVEPRPFWATHDKLQAEYAPLAR